MIPNKALVLYHPMSPWAAKVDVLLMCDMRILFRTAVKDLEAAHSFLARFPSIEIKEKTVY